LRAVGAKHKHSSNSSVSAFTGRRHWVGLTNNGSLILILGKDRPDEDQVLGLIRAECLAQHPRKYTMCAEKRATRSQADLHTDLWGCAARGREDSWGKELCCPWIRRLHPDLRNLVKSAPESLRLCRRSLGHLSEIPLIIYGWNR
jgi:hypothetical protein